LKNAKKITKRKPKGFRYVFKHERCRKGRGFWTLKEKRKILLTSRFFEDPKFPNQKSFTETTAVQRRKVYPLKKKKKT